MKVQFSISYKHIIEMRTLSNQQSNSSKSSAAAPAILELRYAKNCQQYQNYIIAKWNALEAAGSNTTKKASNNPAHQPKKY